MNRKDRREMREGQRSVYGLHPPMFGKKMERGEEGTLGEVKREELNGIVSADIVDRGSPISAVPVSSVAVDRASCLPSYLVLSPC